MEVKFNTNEIVELLKEHLELGSINASVKKLRAEFDFNPFDEDDDPYVGFWPEVSHNISLINDVVAAVVITLQNVVIGSRELQNPEKLDIAVRILDDALELPWYAEMFDGPALKLLVSQAVAAMNLVNWGPLGKVQSKQIEALQLLDGGKLDLAPMLEAKRSKR